jgi:uncharacterized protein YhfF
VARKCKSGAVFIIHGQTWKVINVNEEKLTIEAKEIEIKSQMGMKIEAGQALEQKGMEVKTEAQTTLEAKATSVEIKTFNEVEEAYAYSEGEDDRTLESWKREHWTYWTRKSKKLGFTMKENLPVICENFELIYPK